MIDAKKMTLIYLSMCKIDILTKKIKRIAIVGSPGSGKSYLAGHLSGNLNLPVYYMDKHFWKPNWEQTERKVWEQEIKKQTAKSKWIMEGGYLFFPETLQRRFERADLIIFLNISEANCIENASGRRGKSRPDFPDFLPDTEEAFNNLVENTIKKYGPNKDLIYNYRDKYAKNKFLELTSRDEVNAFIEKSKLLQ